MRCENFKTTSFVLFLFVFIDYYHAMVYNVCTYANKFVCANEVNYLNILVVGCGKVGSNLAITLEGLGHDVSVVDEVAEHLDSATNLTLINFNGLCVCGVPIDVDVLRQAGIENCDAVAAVNSDDNINIMVAELATKVFGIKRVFARVYDPVREKVFKEHLHLHTICPTKLTIEAILGELSKEDS